MLIANVCIVAVIVCLACMKTSSAQFSTPLWFLLHHFLIGRSIVKSKAPGGNSLAPTLLYIYQSAQIHQKQPFFLRDLPNLQMHYCELLNSYMSLALTRPFGQTRNCSSATSGAYPRYATGYESLVCISCCGKMMQAHMWRREGAGCPTAIPAGGTAGQKPANQKTGTR